MLTGLLGTIDSRLGNIAIGGCEVEITPIVEVDPCADVNVCDLTLDCFQNKFVIGGKSDKVQTLNLTGALVPAITACNDKSIISKYCKVRQDDYKLCGNQDIVKR